MVAIEEEISDIEDRGLEMPIGCPLEEWVLAATEPEKYETKDEEWLLSGLSGFRDLALETQSRENGWVELLVGGS